MKQIELSTATDSLATYAETFGQDPVVFTLHGKAIAAVISLDNVDLESLSLSTNSEFLKIIQQSRNDFTKGKTFTLEQMKEELEIE